MQVIWLELPRFFFIFCNFTEILVNHKYIIKKVVILQLGQQSKQQWCFVPCRLMLSQFLISQTKLFFPDVKQKLKCQNGWTKARL